MDVYILFIQDLILALLATSTINNGWKSGHDAHFGGLNNISKIK